MLRQIQMRANWQVQLLKGAMGLNTRQFSALPLGGPKHFQTKTLTFNERPSTALVGGPVRLIGGSSNSFDDMKHMQDKKSDKDMEPTSEQRPRRPLFNPLSRRHSVSQSRVQYIYDKHRELAHEVELRKPKGKQFVTRHSLHSGRQDKIN
ncbi:hypothetical protein KR074_008526 [Drosophila pseudoananassae]|nr:hypothetical protein KR074_008526 [Drosophila pseudoananassae]